MSARVVGLISLAALTALPSLAEARAGRGFSFKASAPRVGKAERPTAAGHDHGRPRAPIVVVAPRRPAAPPAAAAVRLAAGASSLAASGASAGTEESAPVRAWCPSAVVAGKGTGFCELN